LEQAHGDACVHNQYRGVFVEACGASNISGSGMARLRYSAEDSRSEAANRMADPDRR
jgi:hypothetical protein